MIQIPPGRTSRFTWECLACLLPLPVIKTRAGQLQPGSTSFHNLTAKAFPGRLSCRRNKYRSENVKKRKERGLLKEQGSPTCVCLWPYWACFKPTHHYFSSYQERIPSMSDSRLFTCKTSVFVTSILGWIIPHTQVDVLCLSHRWAAFSLSCVSESCSNLWQLRVIELQVGLDLQPVPQ